MEILITDQLMKLLTISSVLSIIVMAIIQQIKKTNIIKKDIHVYLLNLTLSCFIGIPFTLYFYKLTIFDSIWVALFTLVGAPSIYVTLKEQNFLNYTPKSLKNDFSKNSKNSIFMEREF